jgi:hypothetical protein
MQPYRSDSGWTSSLVDLLAAQNTMRFQDPLDYWVFRMPQKWKYHGIVNETNRLTLPTHGLRGVVMKK